MHQFLQFVCHAADVAGCAVVCRCSHGAIEEEGMQG